jgi:hypothetical protein
LTGRIVVAHLKTLDYYQRLEVAGLENDLVKAMRLAMAIKPPVSTVLWPLLGNGWLPRTKR